MLLSEKLKVLRSLEGTLRGLNRPITKSEIVRLIQQELGENISQAYLSQLESGKRPHMTEKTRDMLARFFRVHPGFFVSDPEGFQTNIASLGVSEERLDDWLRDGADRFWSEDLELANSLRALADHEATRELVLLVSDLVRSPDTMHRLQSALATTTALADKAAGSRKRDTQ
jgi:transcriptional regulator with XRE-family HTH domain